MEYWVYALSGVRLDGDLIGEVDERGEAIVGDTMLLLNAHYEAIPFTLPAPREELWERQRYHGPRGMPLACTGGQQYELQGRAMAVPADQGTARRSAITRGMGWTILWSTEDPCYGGVARHPWRTR